MNQNENLKVVVIELLDSLSNDIAEFLFDRTGCIMYTVLNTILYTALYTTVCTVLNTTVCTVLYTVPYTILYTDAKSGITQFIVFLTEHSTVN